MGGSNSNRIRVQFMLGRWLTSSNFSIISSVNSFSNIQFIVWIELECQWASRDSDDLHALMMPAQIQLDQLEPTWYHYRHWTALTGSLHHLQQSSFDRWISYDRAIKRVNRIHAWAVIGPAPQPWVDDRWLVDGTGSSNSVEWHCTDFQKFPCPEIHSLT